MTASDPPGSFRIEKGRSAGFPMPAMWASILCCVGPAGGRCFFGLQIRWGSGAPHTRCARSEHPWRNVDGQHRGHLLRSSAGPGYFPAVGRLCAAWGWIRRGVRRAGARNRSRSVQMPVATSGQNSGLKAHAGLFPCTRDNSPTKSRLSMGGSRRSGSGIHPWAGVGRSPYVASATLCVVTAPELGRQTEPRAHQLKARLQSPQAFRHAQ